MIHLEVVDSGGVASDLDKSIRETRVEIGAEEGCDLVLRAPHVSGRHALVHLGERGYLVRDLGSRNGTVRVRDGKSKVVSATHLEGEDLRAGDELWLGDARTPVRVRVVSADARPVPSTRSTVIATLPCARFEALGTAVIPDAEIREVLDLVCQLSAKKDAASVASSLVAKLREIAPTAQRIEAWDVSVKSGRTSVSRIASAGDDTPADVDPLAWIEEVRGEATGRGSRSVLRRCTDGSVEALLPLHRDGEMFGIVRVVSGRRALRQSDVERIGLLVAAACAPLGSARELERAHSEKSRLRRRAFELEHQCELVGESAAWRSCLSAVEKAARSTLPVLLIGETGTGKSSLAAYLHSIGPRADGPFERVNLSAVPETAIESELVGTMKGAFTDALDRAGRFELAAGGTLVLEEIGELPLPLQVKLVTILDQGAYRRLGATEDRRSNARVIAVTQVDLQAMSRNGSFRPDLYQRLAVHDVRVPPLRERRDDIPLLARALLRPVAEECGATVRDIGDDVIAALRAYDFPGNVRELRTVLSRAIVAHEGDGVLALDDLPAHLRSGPSPAARAGAASLRQEIDDFARGRLLEHYGEVKSWTKVAERVGYTRPGVIGYARRLGITVGLEAD